MKFLIYIAACSLIACSALAQPKSDSTASRASVTLVTETSGARVVLDGDSAGVTPLTVSMATGVHKIKIIPPDIENWLLDPITDSIAVTTAAAETLHASFVKRIMILTTPSGASVLLNDSLIGTTPLTIRRDTLSVLTIQKEGYEPTTASLAEARRGVLSLHLKKIWQSAAEETPPEVTENSSLRLYVAGAATIIAGAASAYFKVKADNMYSQYTKTGDPGALSDTNRLDTAAGISLAITQISLGLFTYFMLTE